MEQQIADLQRLVQVLINQIQATQQTQQVVIMELKRINDRLAKLEDHYAQG